jgi:branched-chain amino acid transport system ATP-binding protein
MSDSLLLDVQGVSKYFGGLQANEDISFVVKRGEIVSIIGPNGAGKSTLFSCVTGFHRVDKGRVLFKGQDITNRKPHTIARLGIVRTFQIVQVISDMTVLENVMTGGFLRRTRLDDVRRKAEEILAFTGLMEKRSYNALELTISDKKRLEVSMALAMDPELLMLDESMAGLTPVELRQINRIDPQSAREFGHRGGGGTCHGGCDGALGPGDRAQLRPQDHGGHAQGSRGKPRGQARIPWRKI